MKDPLSVDDILESLAGRGLYDGHVDHDKAEAQAFVLQDKLDGMLRYGQRMGLALDAHHTASLAVEAAEIVIAAVRMLGYCAGAWAAEYVAGKLAGDEMQSRLPADTRGVDHARE